MQYRSDLSQIWCACHNGHYDLNGKNVAGPPPRPLDTFVVNVARGPDRGQQERVTMACRRAATRQALDVARPAGRAQADLEKLAQKKQIPVHRHSIWYYLGGMTLFLFIIQVSTGILLLLYYRPSAEEAFESVQFLMAEVQFGWLIRSIHSWAANLMILTLFVHLFSVLLLKAYRPPREITWFSGMALLGLALGFGFTGYLLPWNELAYFATKVGTEITGAVPGIGRFAGRLLRGGDEVTGATLTRFYGIHVAILPATRGRAPGRCTSTSCSGTG